MSGFVSFPSGLATSRSNCSPNVSRSTGSSSPVTCDVVESTCDTQSRSLSLMSIMNPFSPVNFSVIIPLTVSG